MRIGAIVLASGNAARFEGGNKLLVPYEGVPMISHILSVLPTSCFAKRLVVTRWEEVAELARKAGFEVLFHGEPDISDTIRLGVTALSDMDGCLFAVGDQPLLRPETVESVVETFQAHPTRIVRAGKDGLVGNPALFPASYYPALCALPQGAGGNAIMKRYPEAVLVAQAQTQQELFDVDTRCDYQNLP
ncbi:MAG: nucleotidyltransferase family protein [Eubacteriales bacterium]|nr:nucleotidyltransferase family protein [Eubacteriales bacterium]